MNHRLLLISLGMMISLSLNFHPLNGQDNTYKYFYRIYFRDKGTYHTSNFTPAGLFSQRAVERRQKEGISGLDYKDLPVYPGYLDSISSRGLTLHCTSRWMNTGLFKSKDPADLTSIQSLPFIENVKLVKNPLVKKGSEDKLALETNLVAEVYNEPIKMLNGDLVHASGYLGTGKLIAVLDGGFTNADKISSLDELRSRSGITATFDFVKRSGSVYDYHKHGTYVLSILAGIFESYIEGSGPGADYMLLRTEDTASEFPAEEDFWAAGAEYADSAGCDIISSSLGYFKFDDPSMDYKYSDMDGRTAFVTRAADAAASKGIVVVNSAGNERDNAWMHIIAPSDGDSVLAIGAVNADKVLAPFSSAGPSFDRRIKPDVSAQGVAVPVQADLPDETGWSGTVLAGNGTSFSCPVISGMIACVMQAVPRAKASEIVSVIREVSDQYNSPDSLYGYGIPDMVNAIVFLQKKFLTEPSGTVTIGPNPFISFLNIRFRDNPEFIRIEIYNPLGILIRNIYHEHYLNLSLTINELQSLKQGMYIMRINIAKGTFTYKVIKVGK
jgi:serine protease AprX